MRLKANNVRNTSKESWMYVMVQKHYQSIKLQKLRYLL